MSAAPGYYVAAVSLRVKLRREARPSSVYAPILASTSLIYNVSLIDVILNVLTEKDGSPLSSIYIPFLS